MNRKALEGVPKSPYTDIPGWDTIAEEDALIRLAGRVPREGVIVELGAECGRSAGAFITGSHESIEVVSVDLFPKDHLIVGDLLAEYQKNVGAVLKNGRRVGLMVGDSAEAAEHWEKDKQIDLLFIDAGHEYESVMRDIRAWVGFVGMYGVVAFHDCATGPDSHYLHHEVNRAIGDWYRGDMWIEHPQVDSLRMFERVK